MKSEFIATFITLNHTAVTSLLHKSPFSIHSYGGTKDKLMETHNFYFKMHLSLSLVHQQFGETSIQFPALDQLQTQSSPSIGMLAAQCSVHVAIYYISKKHKPHKILEVQNISQYYAFQGKTSLSNFKIWQKPCFLVRQKQYCHGSCARLLSLHLLPISISEYVFEISLLELQLSQTA
jgi:hypothetical protein